MKRIIDGLRYDTATADQLAIHQPHGDRRNFTWECSGIYKTKKGRYFLAGEGGAKSRWAQSFEDGSVGDGDGLRPLSDDEARALLEAWGATEALEEHFPVEDA